MNNKRIHRDYAYTLQGWLKDINGYRVDVNSTGVYDIGEDGSSTNYVNKRFGRDLFSSMMQYYQTDYSPISGNNYFNLVSTSSIDLYNGNISAISVGIKDLNPLLKSFRYDKINRIKKMTSAGINNNLWGTLSNLFGSLYSYDFNGNIDTLIRYDENGNLLHNITYTYSTDRNRLSSINVTGTGIGSSSYQYDALGNLIRDNNENINVAWNLIGKVKSVQTPYNILSYAYNPFGQRQIKRTANDSTYYIHDATGNVMSIYVKDYPKIVAKERPIYGNSRVGIMTKEIVFNLTGNLLSKSNSTIGIKEYEISDHINNVCVVVFDRKECNNSVIKPVVKSYTDYYPFGYPIRTRTNSSDYRFGFNGQEKDNEVYGNGNIYTAEYWQYDSRLGRRWNVDPITKPSLSTFSTFANNPIYFMDIFGLDTIFYNKDWINYTIKKGGKDVVKLPEVEVVFLKNPYRYGSRPYIAFENNRDNPNLYKNKRKLIYYLSNSQWQKDFNKAYGWMIPVAIATPFVAEFSSTVLDISISAGPEIISSARSGTQFAKYQFARAYTFSGKMINIYNSTTLKIGTFYQTGYILKIPASHFITLSFFVGTVPVGYYLNKYSIFPPDFLTGFDGFDAGIGLGQSLNNYVNEVKEKNIEKKNTKQDEP